MADIVFFSVSELCNLLCIQKESNIKCCLKWSMVIQASTPFLIWPFCYIDVKELIINLIFASLSFSLSVMLQACLKTPQHQAWIDTNIFTLHHPVTGSTGPCLFLSLYLSHYASYQPKPTNQYTPSKPANQSASAHNSCISTTSLCVLKWFSLSLQPSTFPRWWPDRALSWWNCLKETSSMVSNWQ